MSNRNRHKWRNRTSAVVPDPMPEWAPTFTLNREAASARKRMGEVRWSELNAEWDRSLIEEKG